MCASAYEFMTCVPAVDVFVFVAVSLLVSGGLILCLSKRLESNNIQPDFLTVVRVLQRERERRQTGELHMHMFSDVCHMFQLTSFTS